MLAGGLLTKYLGWEWIFYVNVPVGLAALALTRPLVRESRAEGIERSADPLGAVTITAGLAVLVYAVSKAPDSGWTSGRTIGFLTAAVVLIVGFLRIESRVRAPLVPVQIVALRTLSGANLVGFLLGAAIFSNFFLLTLFVQQVLGFSALKTGLTFLATAGTAVIVAGAAQALTTRVGPRPVMAAGLALLGVGSVLYTQIPVDASYVSNLLPGYVIVGIGIPMAFIPVSIAALAGVEAQQAGLASGLINTSQQIGGAIGVAVASTLLFTRATTLIGEGDAPNIAFTSGTHLAFWVIAATALAGVAASLLLIRTAELTASPTGDQLPTAG